MLTIEDVMNSLKLRNWSVPQPAGKEVADSYKNGTLPEDTATLLHVIAVLLAEVHRLSPKPE